MNTSRQHILHALATAPIHGLTSSEVIRLTRGASYSVQGMLSKMACYGLIDKIMPKDQTFDRRKVCRWRLKPIVIASPSIITESPLTPIKVIA